MAGDTQQPCGHAALERILGLLTLVALALSARKPRARLEARPRVFPQRGSPPAACVARDPAITEGERATR